MVKRKVAPVIRKKVAPLPSQLTANLAFSVKEFPYHQKNHFWYLGITMLLLVVLLVGLRYGNFTLALVALALAGGGQRWQRDLGAPLRAVMVGEGLVYAATATGTLSSALNWADEYRPSASTSSRDCPSSDIAVTMLVYRQRS